MADRLKECDRDLKWALEALECDANLATDCGMHNEAEDAYRLETVMRRLAREAGYDLVALLNG